MNLFGCSQRKNPAVQQGLFDITHSYLVTIERQVRQPSYLGYTVNSARVLAESNFNIEEQ